MDVKTRLLTIRVLERMEKTPEYARKIGLRNASGRKNKPDSPERNKDKK